MLFIEHVVAQPAACTREATVGERSVEPSQGSRKPNPKQAVEGADGGSTGVQRRRMSAPKAEYKASATDRKMGSLPKKATNIVKDTSRTTSSAVLRADMSARGRWSGGGTGRMFSTAAFASTPHGAPHNAPHWRGTTDASPRLAHAYSAISITLALLVPPRALPSDHNSLQSVCAASMPQIAQALDSRVPCLSRRPRSPSRSTFAFHLPLEPPWPALFCEL